MARYRPSLSYQVDWGNDGLYAHPESDVTVAVDSDFRAKFGTTKSSNPDRPILLPLAGGVTLMGDTFSPRSSIVFTPVELRQRRRFRVQWTDGTDTVTLCTGWILNPRIQEPRVGTKLTQYDLEGFLLEDMRRTVALLQLTNNADTVTARTMVETAFGQTLDSFTYDPTALTIFQFAGKAGGFASKFCTVAGAFPTEHKSGGLGLHSPLSDPAGQETIGTPDYVVSSLKSEWGAQHIRNYADVVFFNPEIDRVTFTDQREFVGPGGAQIPEATIRLPSLQTGQRYDNITITPTHEAVTVWIEVQWDNRQQSPTRYDGIYRLSGWISESTPSALAAASITTAEDAMTGETILTVDFADWDTSREWTWDQRTILNDIVTNISRTSSSYTSAVVQLMAQTNFASSVTNPTGQSFLLNVMARRLSYTLSFDIVTNQPAGESSNLLIQDPVSQALWGVREAKFPGWFAFGAVDAIRERIDELAEPRHLHTVDFPLDQRDAAKGKVIADLDTGTYFRLLFTDAIAGVSIAESVMVMNVEYMLGNGRTPTKRVTVIETGNPVAANRLYLGANPLFLDGNPLFVR